MDADKQALERARKVKEDDEAADAAMNDTHPTSARSVAKSLLENWAEAVRRNVS
jgi:hypothetical protein